MKKSLDPSAPIDPDALQQRALAVLERVIAKAEENPALVADKSSVETVVKISEHLRKLNADLNNPMDMRRLSKLSDAELDELEARARG